MKPQKLFGFTSVLETGRKLLENETILRLTHHAGRFSVGLLCSMATIFGNLAPFGAAMVAASGSGTAGLVTLLGSSIGYILQWNTVEALKYIAVTVLIFAGLFVFRGVEIARKPFFMPLVTGASMSFVGIVFVAGVGFPLRDTLMFLLELTLMVGGAYFFRIALDFERPAQQLQRRVGLLLLTAVLLLSLTPLTLLGSILPARAAAAALVMWYATRSGAAAQGAGAGSAAGLTMGIAMDLALGTPFFSMAYGAAGLLAGIFSGLGRIWSVAAYIIVSAIAALWAPNDSIRYAMLAETFIGSVFFVILPHAAEAKRTASAVTEIHDSAHEDKLRRHVQRRLSAGGLAFSELHDSLRQVFDSFQQKNDEDISGVFDRASQKVCRKCALAGVCWDREVTNTYNALNDASHQIQKNGNAAAGDFPLYFSSRCLQFNRYLKTVNEELGALTYRRQYRSRLRESRKQVCEQYAEISRLLQSVATEVGEEMVFDTSAEARLNDSLSHFAPGLTVSVYRVSGGRQVDIEGADLQILLSDMETLLSVMENALGFAVCTPEQQRGTFGDRLTFREVETFRVQIGVAARKKQGEEVSGDSGTYFKTPEGKLHILLSDGMGSGSAANLESGIAVRLLERFLRAGVAPETALMTLNSALILRGEDNLGFVTVDMLIADLINGETLLYKFGAAPSYLRRGGKIARIRCKELPAGLGLNAQPKIDVTRFTLHDGDTLMLASDGVSDATDDAWLQEMFLGAASEPPKTQAEKILSRAGEINGRGDDMTVLVMSVSS